MAPARTLDALVADVAAVSREQERVSATLDAAARAYTETTREIVAELRRLGERLEAELEAVRLGLERVRDRVTEIDLALARLEGVVEGRASAVVPEPAPRPSMPARARVDVARWTAVGLILTALAGACGSVGVAWVQAQREPRPRAPAPHP